jgi:archaellum component FlaC
VKLVPLAVVDMSEERFDRIDEDLSDFRARFESVDARFDELRRHLHVFHEDMIERLASLREFSAPTRVEFFEFKDAVANELNPLKAVVRQHNIDIAKLRRERE